MDGIRKKNIRVFLATLTRLGSLARALGLLGLGYGRVRNNIKDLFGCLGLRSKIPWDSWIGQA